MIKLKQLLRTWMLAIAILLGVLLYFLGDNYLPNPTAKTMAMHWIKTLRPILIFANPANARVFYCSDIHYRS